MKKIKNQLTIDAVNLEDLLLKELQKELKIRRKQKSQDKEGISAIKEKINKLEKIKENKRKRDQDTVSIYDFERVYSFPASF